MARPRSPRYQTYSPLLAGQPAGQFAGQQRDRADPADREYEQQKLAAEQLVLDAHGPELETVVLQPDVCNGCGYCVPACPFGVIDRRDGKLLRANKIVRVNWAKGIDPKTGQAIIDNDAADFSHGPKIIFPGTPGARNWHPASYDPASGLYFGAIQDMGNLMFVPPGDKPYKPKGLNTAAALIFTPQLEAALATLPPPVAAQVKALPAWAEVLKNPGGTTMRAIDPLTGKTVWSQPMAGWQDRGGVLTTASGLLIHGNLSTARFYEHVMSGAPERYRFIAPDMRCFGRSEGKALDATRGLRDWSQILSNFGLAAAAIKTLRN